MKTYKNYYPSSDRSPTPLLSVIIPMFNEAGSASSLFARLLHALDSCGLQYEIICVDDGSTDNTLDVLRAQQLQMDVGNLKIVGLSRNFGKDIALTAGLDYAAGDIVIPIDADLQDPPEVIPEMILLWREGYDVVYGTRNLRRNDTRFKRQSATAFYNIFNILSSIKIPANAGDFRLLDRRVVDALGVLPERNRFMKGLYSWVGFRQTSVSYDRMGRENGQSRWRMSGLWSYAIDGIVAFSIRPLEVWTYIGFLIAAMALLYGLYIVIYTLWNGVAVPGYASLISSVAIIGGLQLGVLGIIGQYVGRMFVETKARPLYLVSALEGFADADPQKYRQEPPAAPACGGNTQ